MAATVLGAVVERIDLNQVALGVSGSGGLWVAEIPEDKGLPMLAVLHLGETPEWFQEDAYLERTTLEIHALALTLAAAETLALAVKDLLDWSQQKLTVAAAAVISCRRTDYGVSLAKFRDAQGRLVFDAATTYEVEIRRTLPAGV